MDGHSDEPQQHVSMKDGGGGSFIAEGSGCIMGLIMSNSSTQEEPFTAGRTEDVSWPLNVT